MEPKTKNNEQELISKRQIEIPRYIRNGYRYLNEIRLADV